VNLTMRVYLKGVAVGFVLGCLISVSALIASVAVPLGAR